MSGYLDGSCCEPDSGECCGPGSWCCARAGKHDHDELERAPKVSAWDILGIAPDWTGGMSSDEFVSAQRDRVSDYR